MPFNFFLNQRKHDLFSILANLCSILLQKSKGRKKTEPFLYWQKFKLRFWLKLKTVDIECFVRRKKSRLSGPAESVMWIITSGCCCALAFIFLTSSTARSSRGWCLIARQHMASLASDQSTACLKTMCVPTSLWPDKFPATKRLLRPQLELLSAEK